MNVQNQVVIMIFILLLVGLTNGQLLFLTNKNLTIAIQQYNPLLIFYSAGDRTSNRFIAQLTEFQNNLQYDIQLAVMSSEKNECKLYYSQSVVYSYNGPLTIEPLQNWLKTRFRQSEYFPSVQLNRYEQLQKRVDLAITFIALFITPTYRLTPLLDFVESAKKLSQDPIFFCHTFKLHSEFHFQKHESGLIFYSPNEKRWIKYRGETKDSQQMADFMKAYQFQGYFEITNTNDQDFTQLLKRKDKLILIITLKPDDDIEQYRIITYKQCLLVKMQLNEYIQKQFNIQNDNLPQYIAIKPVIGNKYPKYITYDSTINPFAFYNKIIYNQIEQYYYKDIHHQDYIDEYQVTHLSYQSYKELSEQWSDDFEKEHIFFIYEDKKQLNNLYQVVKQSEKLVRQGLVQFYALDYSLHEIDLPSKLPSIKIFSSHIPKYVHYQYVKGVAEMNHYLGMHTQHKKMFSRKSDL